MAMAVLGLPSPPWRDCVKWLVSCGLVPPDHEMTKESAEPVTLATYLRDGVVICQLLNTINPGCIDMKEVNLRPQLSQFLSIKNIRVFLASCQITFELKPEDIFDPYMLFDCSDFGRVIRTLSILSRSDKVSLIDLEGFSAEQVEPAENYSYLPELIAFPSRNSVTNGSSVNTLKEEDPMVAIEFPTISGRSWHSKAEEDIYEDLCYVTLRVGRSSVQPVDEWMMIPSEKRDFCIKELVETEKNYIEALNMIVKHFQRPLKDVISQNDRRVIFLHIKDLSQIHSGFHSELFKACTSSQYKISSCFIHWKQKFVIYGSYCSNLPRAQSILDDLCVRNEVINQAVHRCQQAANEGRFKLRDLLSLPMQRILKYHLLLNELIKSTIDSHEDFPGLNKAYDAMLDLGQFINEVKRDSETLQIVSDIQTSITDLEMPENTELKDYGRLQKDGELKMRSPDGNKLKNRYVFIFDKVMLMCKSIRGEQYSYKEALILADYIIEELASHTSSSFLLKEKGNHGWHLIHRHELKTMYTFYAKSDEVKSKWLEALRKALDNVCPESVALTDHTFTLYTFDQPTFCADCERLLRGIFFQGYRCTVCGVAVHKSCIGTIRSCGAPHPPPRPLVPASPSLTSTHSSGDDSWQDFTRTHPNEVYVNLSNLDDFKWFAGPMERDSAQQLLELSPHGTFLVRISPKQRGSFAISLNYSGHVKHMRVCQTTDSLFFLSKTKCFRTIVELVKWYEEHSLAESFHGLNVSLALPFKRVSCTP